MPGIFGKPVDRVDRLSFLPGESEIIKDGDAVALNLWTPPNIVAVAGDVTPFIDHLDYIFDGDLIANGYILDFLPHLVQKPWIKMRIAPLIIGEPEIGKSVIWFRSSLANRTQRQSRKVVCDRRSTSGSMAYSSSL